MNYIKIFVLTLIVWFAQRSIASKIPSDFTSISTLLQSRIKRDNDYEVKCHQSGTGMYYFIIVYDTKILGQIFLKMNIHNFKYQMQVSNLKISSFSCNKLYSPFFFFFKFLRRIIFIFCCTNFTWRCDTWFYEYHRCWCYGYCFGNW